MTTVGDHYVPKPDSASRDAEDLEGPIYRVVGAADEVTLLRVTDDDGRRAHTGEIRHVSADVLRTEFEPAENPDAGLTPIADVRNALSGLYWSFRRFL